MLTTDEKISLIGELRDNQKEISELKKELNLLNARKESEYEKREEVGKQISELIRKIKVLKEERNKFTSQVRENKTKRDELRKELKKKIDDFKRVDGEKKASMKKRNLRFGPDQIRRDIERLESKIVTDAISFEKEQGVMKKIKELKKELAGYVELDAVFSDARKLSKEIKDLKKELDQASNNIKNFATHSQEKHEEMLSLSKQVDELMAKENGHKENFQNLKEKFTETNTRLKEILPKLSNIKEKLDVDRSESKSKKKEEIEKELKEKGSKVAEKIRRREKLTTKDILVFQGTEKDEDIVRDK